MPEQHNKKFSGRAICTKQITPALVASLNQTLTP